MAHRPAPRIGIKSATIAVTPVKLRPGEHVRTRTTAASIAAGKAAKAAAQQKQIVDFLAAQNGVISTGDMQKDFAILKSGKTVWKVGYGPAHGKGITRSATLMMQKAWPVLMFQSFNPDWTFTDFWNANQDAIRRIAAANRGGFFSDMTSAVADIAKTVVAAPVTVQLDLAKQAAKAAGVKLPSRAQALKAGRIAAVAAAVYFAAPYAAAALAQAGTYATAAEAALGPEASSLVEGKLTQMAQRKLMQHFAPGGAPAPSAAPPQQATPILVAAPAKISKPAALTLSAALPFLAFLLI
jgi:hypothetical protein